MDPTNGPGCEDDPFRILGIPPDARPEEIRDAYFDLVKERSPERNPGEFKRIRRAYEALRSPSGRWRSSLMILEAEKDGPLPPLPPPDPISPEEILRDLIVQEEIALGLDSGDSLRICPGDP
jgi:hypothetical protein